MDAAYETSSANSSSFLNVSVDSPSATGTGAISGLHVCNQHTCSPGLVLTDTPPPPEMMDPSSTLVDDKPGGRLFLTLLTAS